MQLQRKYHLRASGEILFYLFKQIELYKQMGFQFQKCYEFYHLKFIQATAFCHWNEKLTIKSTF